MKKIFTFLALALLSMQCTYGQTGIDESEFFITTWEIGNNTNFLTLIPDQSLSYNYNVKLFNSEGVLIKSNNVIFPSQFNAGEFFSGVLAKGTYTLKIKGVFPRLVLSDAARLELKDVTQWGTSVKWKSMKSAFKNYTKAGFSATDTPDLSECTDFSQMFANSSFNQDISSWNMEKATNLFGMFVNTPFNQDISTWNVSNVTNMRSLFAGSSFDQDIGSWDLSSVGTVSGDTMQDMFSATSALSAENYDKTLIGWESSGTINNNVVFSADNRTFCKSGAARGRLISDFGWDITDGGQFCPFITSWEVFQTPGSTALEDITLKMTAGLTYNFDYMWRNAQGDRVSQGTVVSADVPSGLFVSPFTTSGTYTLEITRSFPHLSMDQENIEKLIDVKQWGDIVWKTMESSFEGWLGAGFAATDSPNLADVSTMASMFRGSLFNHDINDWNVGNVTIMSNMFRESPFNKDLSDWNVGKVIDMTNMFLSDSSFNQDISKWNVVKVGSMTNMLTGTNLSGQNYDKMLIAWSELSVLNGVNLGVGSTPFCEGEAARTKLKTEKLWNFTDGGKACFGSDIVSFTIAEQTGAAIIDNIAHTVEIEVASTADITSLQVFMTLSPGAESSFIVSGATVNFTLPEALVVTAADGVVQEWVIFVTQEEPSLGIADQDKIQFTVHPNPFEEVVYIKAAKPFTVSLSSMSGARLRQVKSEGELQLNLAGLSPGMYLLVIENEDGVTTQKLIKK